MTITNYTNVIPGTFFISNNEINLTFIIDYKSIALPAELQGHICFFNMKLNIIKLFLISVYVMKYNRCAV